MVDVCISDLPESMRNILEIISAVIAIGALAWTAYQEKRHQNTVIPALPGLIIDKKTENQSKR